MAENYRRGSGVPQRGGFQDIQKRGNSRETNPFVTHVIGEKVTPVSECVGGATSPMLAEKDPVCLPAPKTPGGWEREGRIVAS